VALVFIVWICAAAIGAGLAVCYSSWKKSQPVQIPDVLSRRLEGKWVIIHTDLPDKQAAHYERFFEGFYDYFSSNYFPLQQDQRLVILLFGRPQDYESFRSKNGGPDTPYGYYMGKRRNAIIVNRERGLGTVTHELVHHFLAIGDMNHHADWINEGVPAFFEKFIGHIDSKGKLQISFGYFSNWRFPVAKVLMENVTIDELFKTDDQCLARSFMLFLHKKGRLRPFVRELRRQGKEAMPTQILATIYGKSISRIEGEWKEWGQRQAIDENVKLVPAAFVKTQLEWDTWWKEEKDRLTWDETQKIYVVRQATESQ